MFIKKIKIIFILFLLYQTPVNSKSNSFYDIDSKILSDYFSGIVAFENKNNTQALNFFNSSKILETKHDTYLKRYVFSLVLENKVYHAINVIKSNQGESNTNFFDAHLLIVLDRLKKSEFNEAFLYLENIIYFDQFDRFETAILETLKQYIYTFKENKILKDKKNFGKISLISETFQRCYLGDDETDKFFSNLFNDPRSDYTRYLYFYLSYLIDNQRLDDAKEITNSMDYIKTTLLLSQGKSWIEDGNFEKFNKVFSCKNHNDIIGEFFFLISNLYSSQDDFKKSNFYLNISNFLNPKFLFNLSLVAENQYLNKEYKKAKKTLKNFKKDYSFYYWFRIKKEAQIIARQGSDEESIKYISSEFNKIEKPNKKFLFDIANYYKNFKRYDKAIQYYSKIIETLNDDAEIKSDLLYRRGGSYERIKQYEMADKDLLNSLELNPDDAYVLNYLAYSWLERDYKIDEAIKMLEKAYEAESDDPYIIDSIGWAYYLVDDYVKAEKFLKRAVELMPDDPIVNDHYGDILWKLNRKIQARYFWANVLEMEDAGDEMLKKINVKLVKGLKNS
mgnify:CR=1 FL=1|tara:strand:+ start:1829 stop:3514 length:1686 start_codon:yes stop_codon:yes gene_type:complete